MKYEKPNLKIMELDDIIVTSSGDYVEGETKLEGGKVVTSPTGGF